MEPGEIRGEQVGEGIRVRVLPPRPGARPVVLSAGPAPARFQSKDRRRGGRPPRTTYWVVAGDLDRPDREWNDYISSHYDLGIAVRSALRRARRLAATPRSKK
ncbi:hypothetical protein SEA_BUMBLE_70 [Arthrobacter phage Bumble]